MAWERSPPMYVCILCVHMTNEGKLKQGGLNCVPLHRQIMELVKVIIVFHHLQNGATPLHLSAMNGHEEVVDVLLRAEAQVNDQTKVHTCTCTCDKDCGLGKESLTTKLLVLPYYGPYFCSICFVLYNSICCLYLSVCEREDFIY